MYWCGLVTGQGGSPAGADGQQEPRAETCRCLSDAYEGLPADRAWPTAERLRHRGEPTVQKLCGVPP